MRTKTGIRRWYPARLHGPASNSSASSASGASTASTPTTSSSAAQSPTAPTNSNAGARRSASHSLDDVISPCSPESPSSRLVSPRNATLKPGKGSHGPQPTLARHIPSSITGKLNALESGIRACKLAKSLKDPLSRPNPRPFSTRKQSSPRHGARSSLDFADRLSLDGLRDSVGSLYLRPISEVDSSSDPVEDRQEETAFETFHTGECVLNEAIARWRSSRR